MILSYASELVSFNGHSFNYHTSVCRSLSAEGVDYLVFTPLLKKNISNQRWMVSKYVKFDRNKILEIKIIPRAFVFFVDAVNLALQLLLFIRSQKSRRPKGLLVESASNPLEHLLVFTMVRLCFPNLKLIYVVRNLQKNDFFGFLEKLVYTVLGGRATILADTRLLVRAVSAKYSVNTQFIPIPFAQQTDECAEHGVGPVSIWLYHVNGMSKGLDEVVRYMHCADQESLISRGVILYVNNDLHNKLAQTGFPRQFMKVFSGLDDVGYYTAMRSCQIALFPYLTGGSTGYEMSSSGVFNDAVCLGLLPLVTPGTWMHAVLSENDFLSLCLTDIDNFNSIVLRYDAFITSPSFEGYKNFCAKVREESKLSSFGNVLLSALT